VSNDKPFAASFGIMNEVQQIMQSGFVEDTGFEELTPAVTGLSQRWVTRSCCHFLVGLFMD